MEKFKIGQIVLISPDSEYSYQNQNIGKIERYTTQRDNYYYWVIFSDGYENSYRDKDLIAINCKTMEYLYA